MSRTKTCVRTRLPLGWHDLETFCSDVLNMSWAPGVASIHTPYLDTTSRRRNPLELITGMQRPSDSALRPCSVNLSLSTSFERAFLSSHPFNFCVKQVA
jgi:hypothetical protein